MLLSLYYQIRKKFVPICFLKYYFNTVKKNDKKHYFIPMHLILSFKNQAWLIILYKTKIKQTITFIL